MLRPRRNAGFACYLKVEAGEWQKLCIVPAVQHNRPVPCNSRFGQLHHNWRQPCRFRFKIRNRLSPLKPLGPFSSLLDRQGGQQYHSFSAAIPKGWCRPDSAGFVKRLVGYACFCIV
jgi:hypothetical protein